MSDSRLSKLRAIVTGAAGVVGTDLCGILKDDGYDVIQTDCVSGITHMDVEDSLEVNRAVSKTKPDLVIHLAAETDVDRCETDVNRAYKINTLGTWNVALACQKKNIPIVYVSTVQIFDGAKTEPYIEFDPPNPIHTYGRTKLEGERLISQLLSRFFIIRAAWMIGGGRAKDKKFVGKIITQLDAGAKSLKAVNDQVGSITYSLDFSRCLANLVKTEYYGVYHMANTGTCTRYDIARHILTHLNRNDVTLEPVTSEAFRLPANRAKSEMLRNYALELRGMNTMRDWREALNDYLDKEYSSLKHA